MKILQKRIKEAAEEYANWMEMPSLKGAHDGWKTY